MNMKDIITANPIIAILRNIEDDILLPYVECILDGGISAIEVAANSENAFRQINILKQNFGKDILIGAGTVINEERIKNSITAGASFFLTPSVTEELLVRLKSTNLPVLPGVFSPSDVALCLKYDMNIMKLFPAGDLPLTYINSLKGPFETAEFIAVGGVNIDNISLFFNAGFLGAGIASSLAPKDKLLSRDWNYIRRTVRSLLENITLIS